MADVDQINVNLQVKHFFYSVNFIHNLQKLQKQNFLLFNIFRIFLQSNSFLTVHK